MHSCKGKVSIFKFNLVSFMHCKCFVFIFIYTYDCSCLKYCFYFNCIIFVGAEAARGNNSSCSTSCSKVLRVRTIHISSPILAAKSPFFYKVSSCTVFYTALHSLLLVSFFTSAVICRSPILCYLQQLFVFMHLVVVFRWYERVRATNCYSSNPGFW